MTARTSDIEKAAGVLRTGGLVALPTETVDGLGANAEDPVAVARMATARLLAEHFWPGPLTLVLRRGPRVPLEATGGLETVAVRVPDHPVALALLAAFGGGVTAPSASRFGSISPHHRGPRPCRAWDAVDFVLVGPCEVGVEST
ncbi:L-threonylcarbamoyladenylate synthase [Streptomyces sp. NPDC046859]|uniref:L-threonylcarbamoyladenylate synthase n=1 Tax=Streptomyces sp. NPDC046859 TaxID=3155734 RepID=UPI0033FB194E